MRALRIAGIVSVALGVYATGLLFFDATFYARQRDEEQRKRARLAQLNAETRTLRVVVAKLAEFQREYQLLDEKLSLLATILPPEPQPEAIEGSLRALASRAGLAFARFSPGQVLRRDSFEELFFECAVAGSHDGLTRFLIQIGRTPRLMTVSRIDVQRGGSRLDATIRIVAYRWRG